jgi:hypothetical protein
MAVDNNSMDRLAINVGFLPNRFSIVNGTTIRATS